MKLTTRLLPFRRLPPAELWNSRLAMLGLFAAVGAELSTGQSALTQFENNTPIVLATWALIAVASFIPMLRVS